MDKFYKKNGYQKIRYDNKKNLINLKKKILNIFKIIAFKKKSKVKINKHSDIIRLYQKDKSRKRKNLSLWNYQCTRIYQP